MGGVLKFFVIAAQEYLDSIVGTKRA